MLQDTSVSCHQRGRGKANYLKKWEVPRHYAQQYANWIIADVTLARVRLHQLGLHEMFGVDRVIVASQCAFFHLGAALTHRLSHLLSHQAGIFIDSLMQ